MQLIADLHVHSKYARATSNNNDIDGLARGAKIKGINIIATGDFTHPSYFNEIKARLTEGDTGTGLYHHDGVHFIISGEISLIYSARKQNRIPNTGHGAQDAGYKIQDSRHSTLRMHHIVLAPSLEIASQLNDALAKKGNLAADGRPTLGLSSPEFADVLFSISKDVVVIPAHAWTPWFSIFGSKSGVDSVEEAFGDQAKNIFALETGLSSSPQMNWMLSRLDRYTLVSNSDAHSLDKLGREANVFELKQLTFMALVEAIKTRKGFVKTYEFYPEEGKYHYDGHRECKVLWSPMETRSHGGLCNVCKKPVTIGVLNRVAELADRKPGVVPDNAVPFQHIVPLKTILSKALKKAETSVQVREEYDRLLRHFGNEFAMFDAGEEQIKAATTPEIAQALRKVQNGEVRWIPGYDGVFGELVLDEKDAGRQTVDRKQKSLADF